MKDILFIGGPEKVQGVERINDDVQSILSVEGLFELRRYVELRKQLSKRADKSIALMHLLGLLQHCDEPTIEVDPQALAVVADLVDADIYSINELLDGWLYVVEAEEVLSK